MKPDQFEQDPLSQQQAVGDIGVNGSDNTVNIVQGQTVTLNQTQIIQVSASEVKTRLLVTASPYKGLKPFQQEDKDHFFGRDQFMTGLVNELEMTNFVLLLGASGSGKSSVVRAGLVPFLSRKWGNDFVYLSMTPDRDPFESLYISLTAQHFSQTEAQVVKSGRTDALHQLVNDLKRPRDFWFLLVDQFEELFTTSEPTKRDAFIRSLVGLCKVLARDPSFKVVATMRADFLGHLDSSPANSIVRVTDGHRPMVTQMQPDELRLAIEQPAAHHGVVFEPGLVREISTDVQGQAGYLPLLQYTLDLLWETEKQAGGLQDRILRASTYRQLGGVRGALEQRVSALVKKMSKAEQDATQRIFLKLVEIEGDTESGTEWRPVRRRAARSEFTDPLEQQVLIQLITVGLLVTDASKDEDQNRYSARLTPTVEIAHEVLLTCWADLNQWVTENRQSIALRNRLQEDVRHWQVNRSDGELWGGSKLERALELRQDLAFSQILGGFGPIEEQFLEASCNRRERQRRRTIAGLAGFSGVALLLAGLAGFQWRQAEVGQVQAVAQSSQAEFALNSDTLEPLLDALRAGGKFQRLPSKGREPQLYDEIMETLTQALFWVKEVNRLEGHTDIVSGVSFSPDGQTLATASFDHTAKIWETTGQEITTLKGHNDKVTSVRFSPQGNLLLTTSLDNTARLWTPEGQEIAVLEGHIDTVWSASFSPDGQTLATASEDNTVRLWSQSGQALPVVLTGSGGGVETVSFAPDGQAIATGNYDGSIEIWDKAGNRSEVLSGHNSYVLSVSYSPDGQTLASASADGKALLWDLGDLRAKPVALTDHAGSVRYVAFSPDNQYVVTASDDNTIKVWDREGTLVETLNGHQGIVTSLSFQPVDPTAPDSLVLASSSNDKTARLWQLGPGKAIRLKGHTDAVYVASFSPDGQSFATAGLEEKILVWDDQGQVISVIDSQRGLADSVNGLNFSLEEKLLGSASSSGVAQLWDTDGALVAVLEGHTDDVLDISFSPTNPKVATASRDGTTKLWDLEGNPLLELEGHTAAVQEVRFSSDGKRLVTASEDGTVKVWDQGGQVIHSLEASTGPVYSAVFSPDNQSVVAGGADNLVRVWDLERPGEPALTLQGHTAPVWSVAFSSDGQKIATASDDKSVKLWRKDGTLITTFNGHAEEANTVAFNPSGTALVTGGSDNRVVLWDIEDISFDQLMATGCDWVRDYLAGRRPTEAKTIALPSFCSR